MIPLIKKQTFKFIIVFLLAGMFFLAGGLLLKSFAKGDSSQGSVVLAAAETGISRNFNHDSTSFSLYGAHRQLECAVCHAGGRYRGIPRDCERCHNGQLAPGMPQGHFLTRQSCSTCHSQSAFYPASFIHDPSTAGQCSNCHNGQKATGKPANHIVTTLQCDSCHRTSGWLPASFMHDASTVGQCPKCHNNQTAPGMPSTHLATTLSCDQCHNTTAWLPVSYPNHPAPLLIGGHSGLDCLVCHSGSFSTAIYRDGTTYGSCANCHRRNYTFPSPSAHQVPAGTGTLATSLTANATCTICHQHSGYSW